MRLAAAFLLLSAPAFAQQPQPDSLVADLQGAWQARAYGEAQAVKAIDAIIKQWQADKAALDAARKEIEALKKEPQK